jgi:hypothetical protein
MNLANQGGEKLFRGCLGRDFDRWNQISRGNCKRFDNSALLWTNSESKLSDLMCETSFKEPLDAVAGGLLACSKCLSLSIIKRPQTQNRQFGAISARNEIRSRTRRHTKYNTQLRLLVRQGYQHHHSSIAQLDIYNQGPFGVVNTTGY